MGNHKKHRQNKRKEATNQTSGKKSRKRNLEAANAAKRARRNASRGNIPAIIGHNETLNEPVISINTKNHASKSSITIF